MVLEALKGDIAELAPQVAQACAIWIRSGFNLRHATWDFRILPAWQPIIDHRPFKKPWRRPQDSLLRLQIADSQLQYAYVFSNPTDSQGYASLQDLDEALRGCLEALSDCEGIERLAFIHMPFSPDNRHPTREDNLLAATQMVKTLREWSQTRDSNPFTHIYLIDLSNDFEQVLATES